MRVILYSYYFHRYKFKTRISYYFHRYKFKTRIFDFFFISIIMTLGLMTDSREEFNFSKKEVLHLFIHVD